MSGNETEPTTARQKLDTVTVPQAVASGAYHSLFLRKDGGVWAWGQNASGQLGRGSISTTPQGEPLQVNGLPPIKALAAGAGHSVALDTDGNVWVWGQNASGQAGLGNTGGTVLVPQRVTALSSIQAIAANGNFSLALGEDGRLWFWGQNTSGQAGTGATSAAVSTPGVVHGLPTLRAIAAGLNHVMALDANGRVWAWGNNSQAQVGTGSTSPTQVMSPVLLAALPRARAIAAGAAHSLILEEQSGNVWAWGQNNFGQVGTGTTTTTPVLTPRAVVGLSGVASIASGHFFSLALGSDGIVKTWGHNAAGQLGNGVTANSATPVSVTGLTDASALAAGVQHALALRPGCPVWGWGSNSQAQLGTGGTSTPPVTAPVSSGIFNTYYFDGDMDGFGDEFSAYPACEPLPGDVEEIDCDDSTPTTYPGAPELCNGVDDSCDGTIDEGNPSGGEDCSTGMPGVCGEGTSACVDGSVTCAQVRQASAEQCDSLDNDCDGATDEDNPGGLQACATGAQGVCGEGVTYCTHGAIECVQKEDASSEVCDARDNDCDGEADEGLSFQTWYRDQDADGYGVAGDSTQGCGQPAGYAAVAGDCDDTRAAVRPGGAEVCDGLDNNCNTQADEGVMSTWYPDGDGDGFGAGQATQACAQPAGHVAASGDCNDTNAAIKPGAAEVCDNVDNNCSGAVDEGLATQTWYRDQDGDTYGTASSTLQSCGQPGGYVSVAGDCSDSNASIRPGAAEVCDSADNNCNGSTDEGVGSTWYRDGDNDGYGNAGLPTQGCSQPSGYVADSTDCNDSNSNVRPGGTEVCDNADNNCNGSTDEGVTSTWYRDGDNDGYGNVGQPALACSQPSGFVANATDCDDANAGTRPGAAESCDSVDNNCNGTADEGVKTTFYRDADNDTYGTTSTQMQACSQPSGYVAASGDCNDSNANIRPGVAEVCDSVDNNCNGEVDDGVGSYWYRDSDGDGYGENGAIVADFALVQSCTRPSGHVSISGDCNDYNSSINPGRPEICYDGQDNDCDRTVDEFACTCPSGTTQRSEATLGEGDEDVPAPNCDVIPPPTLTSTP